MTAINVPPIDPSLALVDPASGRPTRYGERVLRGLWGRTGGAVDKVDAAHVLARDAVPQGTVVAAAGGLQVGGALGGPKGGNVGVALYAAVTGVALLPAGATEGDWAYAVDGRKPGEGAGSGTGVPCFWSGAAWISACSGAAVTA
jgi:hypothetical protein